MKGFPSRENLVEIYREAKQHKIKLFLFGEGGGGIQFNIELEVRKTFAQHYLKIEKHRSMRIRLKCLREVAKSVFVNI